MGTYRNEGYFDEDFLCGCKNVIQNFLPGYVGWVGAPKELSFSIVETMEREYGCKWIDEKTADEWLEKYWATAATTFANTDDIVISDTEMGPLPGEINPFGRTREFCRWMLIVAIDYLLRECKGLYTFWETSAFEFDFRMTIVMWYLLDDMGLIHEEEEFDVEVLKSNPDLYGIDYSSFANRWARDSLYLDTDDESWFCVRGDKIGMLTQFKETDDTYYYTIDVFDCYIGGKKTGYDTFFGDAGKDESRWAAMRKADMLF